MLGDKRLQKRPSKAHESEKSSASPNGQRIHMKAPEKPRPMVTEELKLSVPEPPPKPSEYAHSQDEHQAGSGVTVEELYSLLKERQLSILIIDVRSRGEYMQETVAHPYVMNIDHRVLSDGLTANDIQQYLARTTANEQSLFQQRSKFDQVVFVNDRSQSFGDPTAKPVANLKATIYDSEFSANSLQRPPLLLIGGWDAWRQLAEQRKQYAQMRSRSQAQEAKRSTRSQSFAEPSMESRYDADMRRNKTTPYGRDRSNYSRQSLQYSAGGPSPIYPPSRGSSTFEMPEPTHYQVTHDMYNAYPPRMPMPPAVSNAYTYPHESPTGRYNDRSLHRTPTWGLPSPPQFPTQTQPFYPAFQSASPSNAIPMPMPEPAPAMQPHYYEPSPSSLPNPSLPPAPYGFVEPHLAQRFQGR